MEEDLLYSQFVECFHCESVLDFVTNIFLLSIQILMWFLSFVLLMWLYYINCQMSYQPSIPEINPTSWYIIALICL